MANPQNCFWGMGSPNSILICHAHGRRFPERSLPLSPASCAKGFHHALIIQIDFHNPNGVYQRPIEVDRNHQHSTRFRGQQSARVVLPVQACPSNFHLGMQSLGSSLFRTEYEHVPAFYSSASPKRTTSR